MKALLEAVVADVDDDDPRLVYADWCEENGDDARAQFIRTQVESARLPPWRHEQIALHVAERALLAAHGDDWRGELPAIEGVAWGEFRRGFVSHASTESFEALAEVAEELARITPVRHLDVYWPADGDGARSVPSIPTLRSLAVDPVERAQPRHLAASPLMSTVTELWIQGGWGLDDQWAALLGSSALAPLKQLRLGTMVIGPRCVDAIVGLTLRVLRLHNIHEADAMDLLFDGLSTHPQLSELRCLDLRDSMYMEVPAVIEAPGLKNLHSLGLEASLINADDIVWDSMSPQVRLEVLSLNRQNMVDAEPLHGAPSLSELRTLRMCGVACASEDVALSLFKAFESSLQVLDARGAYIELRTSRGVVIPRRDPHGGAVRAYRSCHFPQLHTFKIGRRPHMIPEPRELLEWVATQPIERLHLVGAGLEDTAEAFADASLPRLRLLEIEGASPKARAQIASSGVGKRLSSRNALHVVPAP